MRLQLALNEFFAHVANAVNFADPQAFMAEKEAEFKQAVAAEHTELAERIDRLEEAVQAMLEHPALSVPGIVIPPGAPAQPNPPALPSDPAADPAPL